MYVPQIKLSAFAQLPVGTRLSILHSLLNALTLENLGILYYNNVPSIYQIAPKYKLKVADIDEWLDIPDIIKRKTGDCKDFACWRAAELMRQGESARPFIQYKKQGDVDLYHIVVQRGNGQIEDPSKLLGMPSNINYNDIKR